MGNTAPCCGPKDISRHNSNLSSPESGWKLLVKHELKTYDLDASLNWPNTILSAVRQYTPIRPEKSFIAFSRWFEFLSLPTEDAAMQYDPLSHSPNHNFFDYLTEDFQCPDNPVGLVISAFSQGFILDFHDPVQDLIANSEGAGALYLKMLDSIGKFKTLAYKLTCDFYKNVAVVVQGKLEDAEALLFTFMLQGEVYRLLYTTASLANLQSSHNIRQAIEVYLTDDALSANDLYPTDAATTRAVEQSVKSIRLMGASESPFEKVNHLDTAVMAIYDATADRQTRTKLIALSIIKSKLVAVLANAKLIDDFVGRKRAGLTIAFKEAVEMIERLIKA